MAYPYITAEDVKKRIGHVETSRIYDDADGASDPEAIEALARDSSARVAAALRASRRYNIDLIAANTPSEVIRLSLDVAVMYAAQRHPEAVRKNWEELNQAVSADLKALVNGDMMLDSTLVLSGDDGVTPRAAGGTPQLSSDCQRGW